MSWWDEFPPSTPRPVADGLKAQTQRGSFGKTWWGKRWIAALEALGWSSRLQRGRSYARHGQVADLEVANGEARAQVQGSVPRPYAVRIALNPLAEEQWERAFERLAREAGPAARLLAGEMPTEVEEAFVAAKAPLFPASANDLQTSCSCPDFVNPCKHVAAVHYLLAEEFDRDPFLLFALRGRDREAVMEGLRRARDGATAEPDPEPVAATAPAEPDMDVATFWDTGEGMADWRVTLTPPNLPHVVLRRLGPPDFVEDPSTLVHRLQSIYTHVTDRALDVGLKDPDDPDSAR